MTVRTDLFNAKFVKRSDVANNGICVWSGVTVPGCKSCENPYLKEKDELGRDLMHSHDCQNKADYACTIPERKQFFKCGGMTEKPQGFCTEHARIHARTHNVFSQRLDQQVMLFAVVYDK